MLRSLPRDTHATASRPDSWRERWFAGITWKGLALIAVVCLVHTLRRVTYQGDDWLWHVGVRLVTVWILMAITMLSVVATFNRAPRRWRYVALAIAAVASTNVGMALLGIIEARGWQAWLEMVAENGFGWSVWELSLRNGAIVLLCAAVFVFYRVREEHEAATRAAELDRARSEQQLAEARLAMLQAQIEPHFLFNTLANVRRLYETRPAAGESMLDNLMRYLTVALPQMRADESSLEREATLAESYLNIQQVRMGRRLAVQVDIPQALRGMRVPPMMLLTLVENAIKHGLNPLPEGGYIRLRARRDGDLLQLQVEDSGQGFTKSSGAGTGLANTRARLAALHGDRARLNLSVNRPHGVTATIVLPCAPLEAAMGVA